jgi:two-component system LytT family response regulator
VERARREWRAIAVDDVIEGDRWRPTPRLPHAANAPQLEETPEPLSPAPKILVGEREHRWYIFEPERVEYIESHGNYVKIHAGNAEYISRNSIKMLGDDLKGRGFVRIERSLLINMRAILYAQRAGRGTFAFTLTSGTCLRSGATYRHQILRVLPLAHPFV